MTLVLVMAMMVSTIQSSFAWSVVEASKENTKVKNVIIMIPDGMSVTDLTLARWYKSYSSITGKVDTTRTLALDEMASGLVRTYWQTGATVGAITDSAPAGTAFATGIKTNDKYIGSDENKKPIASILEAAKLAGMSTGVIATSNVQHATPADFTSHYYDRSKYEIIGEQQVYEGIDVVLGGGSKYLGATGRADAENLINVIKNEGYNYVTDKTSLANIKSGKIWGMFAADAMAYNMDITENASTEPTLAEMTSKAVEVLSQNEEGFFLMVEGSKVDWAAHANDPIGVISDTLAFDDAVKVALDYAKKNQNTVVLAVTDHGNGGLTIGNADTSVSYSKDPVSKFIAPLKNVKLTGEGLEKKLNADKTNIIEVMSTYYGITDLTQTEIDAIKAAKAGTLNGVVGPMISKRAYLGWTTTGHTGEDVVLFSYMPGDQRLTGLIDNTDIAKVSAGILGLNLADANKALFNNATAAFTAKGATVTLDTANVANARLIVEKGTKKIILLENKNYCLINGAKWTFDGIVVNIDGTFYVPQEVLDFIQ